MKTLVTLGLLTLVCFLIPRLDASSFLMHLMEDDECCERITQMEIPKRIVLHAEMTPDYCYPRAMIITTTRNYMFCIDPETEYAKKHLSVFLKPSNSTS